MFSMLIMYNNLSSNHLKRKIKEKATWYKEKEERK
jgi:hypothetical protein